MPLHVRTVDQVLHLVIDRPERRNALDLAMWHALRDAAQKVDHSVRAVVIYGAGEHFCAGMDLSAENPLIKMVAPALMRGDDEVARAVIRELKDCVGALADIPCPTIAAIEGACLGGGLEVALACDMRIAASNATLSIPETRIGMVPDVGGSARLTRLVGPGRAADLILTGRRIDGAAAFALGLVERVTEPGRAVAEALAAAADITLGAPEATRLSLGVIRNTPDLGLAEALALETQAGVYALTSGEAREGVAAFQEKRAPRWG